MIIKKHKLKMFLVKTTKILENLIIWCTIIVRCNLLKCIFTHRIYDKMWVGIIGATSILMWNVDFVSKEQNICVAVSEWPFVCDHSSHLVSSFFEFTSVQPPTQLPKCASHSLYDRIFSEFEFYIIWIGILNRLENNDFTNR